MYQEDRATLKRGSPMLDWALAYAKHDQTPVFPCIEKSGIWAKAPYKEKGLIEHGHLEASTDPKLITLWWLRWPDALIGRPVPKHLICLDLDPRKGGTIEALTEAFGELPKTEFVMSGRGDRGAHLFYLRPEGNITASVLKKVCPGVDIKLDTGYTILPPSLHPDSKKPYQWGGPDCNAPLPEAIRKVIQPPPAPPRISSGTPSASGLAGILRRVAEEKDNRNDLLYWGASCLRDDGYPESAFTSLKGAARHAGLGDREITKTINSALKGVS